MILGMTQPIESYGAPGAIRTPGLLIRSHNLFLYILMVMKGNNVKPSMAGQCVIVKVSNQDGNMLFNPPAPSLNARRLCRYANKLWLTWSHPYAP